MNDGLSTDRESSEHGAHVNEHLVIDLIQGLLSPAEEKQVLSHLARCPACEKLFQERAAQAERIGATMVLRSLPGGEMVLERRGTALRAGPVEAGRGWGRMRRWWEYLGSIFRQPRYRLVGAMAAAAAVILLLVWPRYVKTPEGPGLYLLPRYSFQLESREVQLTAPAEDLRAGLEAYQAKDFERAIDLLKHVKPSELSESEETIRKIYLGSALAWRGDHVDAVRVLEDVALGLVPGEWGREAHWTLYIGLRESGRQASADSLLRILAGEPDEVGRRARQELRPSNGGR